MALTSSPLKPWTTAPRKRYRLVDCNLIDPKNGQVFEHVAIDLSDGLIRRMSKLSKWPSPGDEVLSCPYIFP